MVDGSKWMGCINSTFHTSRLLVRDTKGVLPMDYKNRKEEDNDTRDEEDIMTDEDHNMMYEFYNMREEY